MNGLLGLWPLALCVALRAAGTPSSIAMLLAGLCGMATGVAAPDATLSVLARSFWNSTSEYGGIGFAAIALIGVLAARARVPGRFLELFLALAGSLRGGRLAAGIAAAMAGGMLSGSAVQAMRATGSLLAARFDEEGWSRRKRLMAIGLVGAMGSMPPLGFAVLAASLMTEHSVAHTAHAAAIGGLLLAVGLVIFILIAGFALPRGEPFAWRDALRALWNVGVELLLWVAIPALSLRMLTATELLAALAAYALVLYGWHLRDLRLDEFAGIAGRASHAFITAIAPMVGAIAMSYALVFHQTPGQIIQFAEDIGPWPAIAAATLLAWALGFGFGHVGATVLALVVAWPALKLVGFGPIGLLPIVMASGVAAVHVLVENPGVPPLTWFGRIAVGTWWLAAALVLAFFPWEWLDLNFL